jgi:GNAT superfamily N-acetyltransferase
VPGFPGSDEALLPRECSFQGKAHLLRLLRSEDRVALQDFFYSHDQETIHYRYGYMISEMTPERANSLVSVDQNSDLALALFSVESGLIQAVGRYCLNPDGSKAELAVVVSESMRRLGVARLLVGTLLKVAQQRGLKEIYASVLSDNAPMLLLLRSFHFQKMPSQTQGSVELRLKLKPLKPQKRPSPVI